MMQGYYSIYQVHRLSNLFFLEKISLKSARIFFHFRHNLRDLRVSIAVKTIINDAACSKFESSELIDGF